MEKFTFLEQVFNYVLAWCGMVFLAGISAKLLVSPKNLHGTLSTFMIGFFASLAAGILLKLFFLRFLNEESFTFLQPITFFTACALGAGGLYIYLCMIKLFRKS
ncbi:MAG: hypothetical protein E7028_08535 [Planctomycetaceae bacterium]|nr:hypothetical protein [Planctomycetaceae bacterium]MBQ2820312.1 hypothetical protein [Thermoguttaceae bacterium]